MLFDNKNRFFSYIAHKLEKTLDNSKMYMVELRSKFKDIIPFVKLFYIKYVRLDFF